MTCSVILVPLVTASAIAQDPVEVRLDRLEKENAEMRQQLDAMGQEVERLEFGDVIPKLGEGRYGLAPGASKIYSIEQGLSIGGYGEFLFQEIHGGTDKFDALRAILYVGYKFDERWVLNSEFEFEHGTTSATSGTTDSGGSVSVEFSYLEYLWRDEANLRGGLVLVPMGFINELHEPTSFLTANRPETERRIIPTTWRELGAGMHGEIGGFAYRGYLLGGLDGERFSSAGIRDARQSGNRTAADDLAGVLRVDWVGTAGLLAGGSIYYGNAGQDGVDENGNAIPTLGTTIAEAHVDWRPGPFALRALYASSWIDDAGAFNASTGENLAERMEGWYVEAGLDVLAWWAPDSDMSLTPYVRWEDIDTQASMPDGYTAEANRQDEILTVGLNFKPIDQVVVKLDFEDRDQGADRLNLLLGYVF
jgi:hypothetical protein